MLNDNQYERYSRQIALAGIGVGGQEKLLAARVLVIGAGGLGCPVLLYLTAAGVGNIGIVDDDIVSLSNLHRQILFGANDIGNLKVNVAVEKLSGVNPDVNFTVYNERITTKNAWKILSEYDLVIDGSDNFSTRYLVNDACVLLNKTLVHGSVYTYEGQVAVFNCNGSANYRDLFAEQPKDGEVPNCSDAGVIGILPGIIGNLMANEVIKIISGNGKLLTNKLLTYNSLSNNFYEMEIEPKKNTRALIPESRTAFENMNYEESCLHPKSSFEVEFSDFNKLIETDSAIIIDIRENGEMPLVAEFAHEKIPIEKIIETLPVFNKETIVLFCKSGKRSFETVEKIRKSNPDMKNIFSLRGGIENWKKLKK